MEIELSQAVSVLERTPGALSALLGGLPEPWLTEDEGPDTFSPRDVLGHLIHGEETDWVPRMRIILEHGESVPFTPFDRFAFRTASIGQSTPALLERFAARRRESLRAVADEATGYAHASELSEAAIKRAADAVGVVKLGHSGVLADGPRPTWKPG